RFRARSGEGGAMLITVAGQARVVWPFRGEAVWLLGSVVALIAIGLIAMGSASVEYAVQIYGSAFAFVQRYLFHFALGLLAAAAVYRVPMATWQRTGWLWLLVG